MMVHIKVSEDDRATFSRTLRKKQKYSEVNVQEKFYCISPNHLPNNYVSQEGPEDTPFTKKNTQ